jgi:Na+/H+ antiporter NhaD/arsenite permease-like protein
MSTLLLILIGLGFISIVVEDIVHINKAKTTLFFGTLVWMLFYIAPPHELTPTQVTEALNENLLDIATLWLFLMAAMTFVAYMSAKGLIDALVAKLLPRHISERKLMLITGLFAFFLSSFADNITATLVCVGLLMSLNLPTQSLLKYLTLVIFAVNAGGASLITGDVTTLMIFLAGKVQITQLLLLILPALCSVMFLALLLSWNMKQQLTFEQSAPEVSRLNKFIGVLFVFTIVGTLLLNVYFSIPPVLCFLFGLSTMFLLVQFSTKEVGVLDYIRRIEFDTLLFFLGVLLLVGMLKELGILKKFPELYQHLPVWLANYCIGLLSSMFDNVPLTAALLKSGVEMSLPEWLLFTYSVGVGGSLLVIGSAAGVVAMSKVEELTFIRYLKFIGHLLLAYTLGFVLVMVIAEKLI